MLSAALAVDSFASVYADLDALLKLRPGLTADFILGCTLEEIDVMARTVKKHGPTRLI